MGSSDWSYDVWSSDLIASLVGTNSVLDATDRAMSRGYLINKFRGDVRLFDAGLAEISRRTGWMGLGVVPWLVAARRLPAEDAVAVDDPGCASGGAIMIAGAKDRKGVGEGKFGSVRVYLGGRRFIKQKKKAKS